MMIARESAEIVALQVLSWLAANDDLFPIFQSASGASSFDIQAGAHDPAFLGAVLDFVLQDDAWVVACCDHLGLDYDHLARNRAALPGGEEVNWT
ncbi:MAG: DUF3572 domain-containing protein [Pseudomonadota bacterium]